MRVLAVVASIASLAATLPAQPPGKWPPDSLINTHVIPRTTPVTQVVGMMRNFTAMLGVRCEFCHVGEADLPIERFDFASDEKRHKLVARQMMRMVQEINRRIDTIPQRGSSSLTVTCATCHRGVSRPVPLFTVIAEAAIAVNADSALRAYRALRATYFGQDAYDFSESALNIAAFRTGRGGKPDDALAILRANEELFPNSSGMSVFRDNIHLMKGDTASAAAAFREAVRRDSTNEEARGRLRAIGQRP